MVCVSKERQPCQKSLPKIVLYYYYKERPVSVCFRAWLSVGQTSDTGYPWVRSGISTSSSLIVYWPILCKKWMECTVAETNYQQSACEHDVKSFAANLWALVEEANISDWWSEEWAVPAAFPKLLPCSDWSRVSQRTVSRWRRIREHALSVSSVPVSTSTVDAQIEVKGCWMGIYKHKELLCTENV